MITKEKINYHPAYNKKHTSSIILIHHLGGVPEQLKNHIDFLNQNGFAVYSYPTFLNGKSQWKDFLPLLKKTKAGVVKIWTEELEEVLDQCPGNKILFSFSFPSLAALLAASRRKDIKAVICDSGPFSYLFLVTWRFFTYYQSISNIFLKIYLTSQMYLTFKAAYIKKDIQKQLPNIPINFPVLSIQSLKDQQVPPSYINRFFSKIKKVRLTVCLLKHSAHLQGLKTETNFYIKNILNFLNKISSPP